MFEAKFPFEIESSARRQLHRGHDSCRPHNTRRARIKCSTWPDAKDFNWLAREIHADVVIPRPSETPTRLVSKVMGFCVCNITCSAARRRLTSSVSQSLDFLSIWCLIYRRLHGSFDIHERKEQKWLREFIELLQSFVLNRKRENI